MPTTPTDTSASSVPVLVPADTTQPTPAPVQASPVPAPVLPPAPDAPLDLNETWQQMLSLPDPATKPSPKSLRPPDISPDAPPPVLPVETPPPAPVEPPPSPAPQAPVSEPPSPVPDAELDFESLGKPLPNEETLVERLRVEAQRRINAQKKIGEQGQELNQLRTQVAQLTQAFQQMQAPPPVQTPSAPGSLPGLGTPEEIAARLLEDPVGTIAAINASRTPDLRAAVAQVLAEQNAAYAQQEAELAPAIAGDAGFALFAARFADQIGQDPAKWQQSEDGQAVLRIIQEDPDRQAALERYVYGSEERAPDEQGVARVLGRAYKDHLKGRKAAAVRKQAVNEIRRIESAKSSVVPVSSSPALRSSPPKTFDEMTYRDILALGTD